MQWCSMMMQHRMRQPSAIANFATSVANIAKICLKNDVGPFIQTSCLTRKMLDSRKPHQHPGCGPCGRGWRRWRCRPTSTWLCSPGRWSPCPWGFSCTFTTRLSFHHYYFFNRETEIWAEQCTVMETTFCVTFRSRCLTLTWRSCGGLFIIYSYFLYHIVYLSYLTQLW